MRQEALIAVFIDFENLALGIREGERDDFRIDVVLQRLLQQGRIVFKRAYCDWTRFRGATRNLHAHGVALVDIPQSKISGKNSADIHMVVDALDLAYAKDHIDVFVLVSGDSDFSPLVSKLKENNKRVVGVGVKSSTSVLLRDGCDEFIFYDDLLRDADAQPSLFRSFRERRGRPSGGPAASAAAVPAPVPASKPAAGSQGSPSTGVKASDLQQQGLAKLVRVVRSLARSADPVWGSTVKQAIRQQYPDFTPQQHGYGSFVALLEDAAARDYVDLTYDEGKGNFRVRLQPE